jgi:hypothetical protein
MACTAKGIVSNICYNVVTVERLTHEFFTCGLQPTEVVPYSHDGYRVLMNN